MDCSETEQSEHDISGNLCCWHRWVPTCNTVQMIGSSVNWSLLHLHSFTLGSEVWHEAFVHFTTAYVSCFFCFFFYQYCVQVEQVWLWETAMLRICEILHFMGLQLKIQRTHFTIFALRTNKWSCKTLFAQKQVLLWIQIKQIVYFFLMVI